MITVLSKPQLVKKIEFRPLDVEAVQARLQASAIPWSIRHLAECSSTQDLAQEAALGGHGPGLVVSTDFQRTGRGRRGGIWTAQPGSSLLVSILLQPPPALLPLTPLLAGIAVVQGIESSCGLSAELEWPNDVMAGGRKLAGILVQRPPGPMAVVGIGVNVGAAPSGLEDGARATSLNSELGRAVAREPLLAAILEAVARGQQQAVLSGPAWVRQAWLARTSMMGRRLTFEDGSTERVGTAQDLLEDGALVVRLDDGSPLRLVAGAVRHVRTDLHQS